LAPRSQPLIFGVGSCQQRALLAMTAKENRLHHVRKCIQKKTDAVSVVNDGSSGMNVTSVSDQNEGTLLLSCGAALMALEPCTRRTRCGFCSRALRPTSNIPCSSCGIVAVCDSCHSLKSWHSSSGECTLFQALVQVVGDEASLDSCLLLTMRLLFRQWYDTQQGNSKSNEVLPPMIDWKLFGCLYATPSQQSQDDDDISLLLSSMRQALKRISKDITIDWLSREAFDEVLGRVLGCSHAITDFMLPLGEQCVGRALFLEHSFYNHACMPNAYLSCTTEGDAPALMARVHLLQPVTKDEPISISYLPLSGLSKEERQSRLQAGYHFTCRCAACSQDLYEEHLKLFESADVESLRQVQFSCHSDLLRSEKNSDQDQVDSSLGMLRMLQRGLENQKIPKAHEVRLELHRLLAWAYMLDGKTENALHEHEAFFKSVQLIAGLFDPVAEATQRLEYGSLFKREQKQDEISLALRQSLVPLGEDHEFVKSITQRQLGSLSLKKRKLVSSLREGCDSK